MFITLDFYFEIIPDFQKNCKASTSEFAYAFHLAFQDIFLHNQSMMINTEVLTLNQYY